MFGGPEVSYHQTYSARDWLSILKTPYPTPEEAQDRTQMTTKVGRRAMNPGLMKIRIWNVRGLYEELKRQK